MRDMKARRIMKKIKNNYTNFILTMTAVALFGINYHLFSGDIISSAKASHGGGVHKIAICNESGSRCSDILVARRGTGEAWYAFATR